MKPLGIYPQLLRRNVGDPSYLTQEMSVQCATSVLGAQVLPKVMPVHGLESAHSWGSATEARGSVPTGGLATGCAFGQLGVDSYYLGLGIDMGDSTPWYVVGGTSLSC